MIKTCLSICNEGFLTTGVESAGVLWSPSESLGVFESRSTRQSVLSENRVGKIIETRSDKRSEACRCPHQDLVKQWPIFCQWSATLSRWAAADITDRCLQRILEQQKWMSEQWDASDIMVISISYKIQHVHVHFESFKPFLCAKPLLA